MTKIEQKLHVYNSAFEINNEDILNLNLKYELGTYGTVYYKEGKRYKEETKPCITFELTGTTIDKKEVWFEFELHLGLDELNKYRKRPINISKNIFFDGPSLQIGEEEPSFLNFRYSLNNINDMYHKLAEAYVYKKEKNVFIFKFFSPEDKIFTYFEVDFNEVGE